MLTVDHEAIKIFHKMLLLFKVIDDGIGRLHELLLSQKTNDINTLNINIMQAVVSIVNASREHLPEYAAETAVKLEDELYVELHNLTYALTTFSYDYALYCLDKSLVPAYQRWRELIETHIVRHTEA